LKSETLFPFYKNSIQNTNNKKTKSTHYSAEVLVELEDRDGNIVPIRALLDTGTSATLLLRQFIKKGRAKGYIEENTSWMTLGGNFVTNRKAVVDFKFPELSTNKSVSWTVHVDHKSEQKTAAYDMIIGMDLMTDIGIYVNTENKTINWEGNCIPLKARGELSEDNVIHTLYHTITMSDILFEAEERQARILDANYEKADIDEVVKEIDNLNEEEKRLLSNVLKDFPILFGGGLGTLNVKPVHLELKEGAKPYHAKPFPIPQSLRATTMKEMDRLTECKVFKKSYESEWAAPTFVQKKKTGDVRILTDFRRLNDMLKRKPFPLPKINDLLQRLEGFQYATAIDLSMGYYHIPLDKESSQLCTTILPWGKYQYLRLPMGIKNSPDVFQAIMQDLLGDLEYVQVYIDDILITSSDTFEEHMQKLRHVLQRLETAGFRANVRKCYFAQDQLEYLGYLISRNGIQPQPKKVEAILRLQAPKTKRQLRHFLGMVNYYRDVWQRRSHLMAPLSGLVGKETKYVWGLEQQNAFEEIKRVIAKETLLSFPDFSKDFHVYTDASDKQLGAVIMQDDKPLAFYSRKLNPAQKRYTTGEQELLSIVETLKEFRNILFGQKIIVHTDHLNILYGKMSNDRIIRWRLLLEEYGPTYVHVAGKDNVVADALSRMEAEEVQHPLTFCSSSSKKQTKNAAANVAGAMQLFASTVATLTRNESTSMPDGMDAFSMAHSFLSQKDIDLEKFPMNPALIAREQKKDKVLMEAVKRNTKHFPLQVLRGLK
jgi:hypothetical protein